VAVDIFEAEVEKAHRPRSGWRSRYPPVC
jgi:hypothetical protein